MVYFMYTNVFGRLLLKVLLHTKLLKIMEKWVKHPSSRILIKPFIKRGKIEMRDFEGIQFKSYADFFARKKDHITYDSAWDAFISPCDSMLSLFNIDKQTFYPVKNMGYKIEDLIPDSQTAALFEGGLCMIFRLRASDYHHFCYIDDCEQQQAHFMQGLLHSVQPIACEREPVYRLNRRQWSLLHTKHFGCVAQIEVGAVLVGGMVHEVQEGNVSKGDEMGHFELLGSTIVLMLTKETAQGLVFERSVEKALSVGTETEVKIGQRLGVLKR